MEQETEGKQGAGTRVRGGLVGCLAFQPLQGRWMRMGIKRRPVRKEPPPKGRLCVFCWGMRAGVPD